MLHFIQSNRLEKLFDRLCHILSASSQNPLQPVEIVVQNPGMGRWISQQMALKKGIAANLHFPLPARFFRHIIGDQINSPAEEGLYDRDVMHWRILDVLAGVLDNPHFTDIKAYLLDDSDGRKTFHLGARIADLFDQYLVYRPDMLLDWEKAGSAVAPEFSWQAVLWQRLAAAAEQHRARHFAEFFTGCEAGGPDPSLLPEQIYIFGVSSLAPVYLQILHAVARHADVYFFYLNPCRVFWDDILSDADVARKRKRANSLPGTNEERYYFTGNPLLAAQGKLGREFINQLYTLGVDADDDSFFAEPEGSSMLATLQHDILDLVDRSGPGGEKLTVEEGDHSVQFHSCHSRMREVQVLHDRLLDMFERNPELKPGDILVMAPNIEEYAPPVRSVFNGAAGNLFIPWSLADRAVSGEEPLAASFLSLFELCTGRCTAPEIVSFLEAGAVMRRFRIEEEDLVTIRNWIEESGIRWGLDQGHRQDIGCPTGEQHSWSFGVNRLLMGYLVGGDRELVHGVSACRNLSSGGGILLGRLAAFLDRVGRTRAMMENTYSPEEWAGLLMELLDSFYDPGSIEEEQLGLHTLRERICTLRDTCRLAGFAGAVTLPVIRDWLREALTESSGGQGFLSGRVTFCNMVPMRSVPFKVICLLGMNDSDYPRQQVRSGFDLMGREPRPGDRNRRDDDRYLFLEAIISTRKVLYMSWLGRNQQDNSPRPPSLVVADLIDYVQRVFMFPAHVPETWPVFNHPLQPFSPKCFSGEPGARSYAAQWLPIPSGTREPVFIDRPLDTPGDEWRTVDLGRLVRFWSHPVRFFLEQRLDLQVRDEDNMLKENEPFHPDSLERYLLEDRMISTSLQDRDPELEFSRLQAEGLLPHGSFGRNLYRELRDTAEGLLLEVQPLLQIPEEPQEVDLAAGPFRITGRLGGLFSAGCIRYRPAKLKGRDLVKLWIEHLVYTALGNEKNSIFVAREETVVLQPVKDPLAELENLLQLYWRGLSAPLHFYPQTSWAWFKANEEKRYADALQSWKGGYMASAEGEDIAYRIALAGIEPLDEEFQRLAEEVYGPLQASFGSGE